MPKILEITELGDPVLREEASDIIHPLENQIKTLIEDMKYTAYEVNGVGLAAPQVNRSLSIFIISSEPNNRYPDAPELGPLVIINPEIVAYSDEMEEGWEGCLSIPGIRGIVPRHKSIKASYTDSSGKEITAEFTDFPARIFQHEYDHLKGIVFLDRIESTEDIITEKEYRKLCE
jgi:peptide deformylase